MAAPQIAIRFVRGPAFSAELLSTVISLVEETVFRTEYADLIAALEELEEIPSVVRDAAIFRIDRYQGRSLQIEDAHSDSIILVGAIAGLAYWILDKTLGETFKEAWVETPLHKKLKEFFISRRKSKLEEVQERLRPEFRRYRFDRTRRMEVHTEISSSIQEETLTIEVIDHDILPMPPAYDDALRPDRTK
jgi:hypothetical protein